MSLNSAYDGRLELVGRNITIPVENIEGGELDSDESKKRTATLRKQKARGGVSSRSNISCKADCTAELWAIKETLEQAVEEDAPVRVVKQMLTRTQNGAPVGDGKTFTGVLKKVAFPPYDLNSSDDGDVEFEVSADE